MADEERITYIDKHGSEYDMGPAADEDRGPLIEMYDNFMPKAVTQGLPPADERARLRWVQGLLDDGENFLAWRRGEVVGHCSLILDQSRADAEYLIFVSNPFRNRGVGTGLTEMAVARARELGLKCVWLTVEALNFRAIKLYKRIGFVFCDSGERERTMILRL
jgi:RimJ/RimL family protein N-acetyltransferase